MSRHPLIALLLLPLAACGMTEERFAENMAELTCEAYEACGITVAASCVSETEQAWLDRVTNEGCNYDARAARRCTREAEDRDPTEREGCRITDGIDACQSVCGAAGDTGG